MFTFSTGFEAASLKFPSSDGALDKDGQKKQIIGFAKFHSRMAALEARDILTGRRVDADSNYVLKAEMAKKDLHTRRGLSSLGPSSAIGATFGPDASSGAVGSRQLPPQSAMAQMQKAGGQKPQMPLTGVPPQAVPRTASLTNTTMASAVAAAAAGRRPEHLRISGGRAFNPFNDAPLASAPIMGAKAHRGFGGSSAFSTSQTTLDPAAHHVAVSSAAAAAASIPQMPGTAGAMGTFIHNDQLMASHSNMMLNRRGSVHGSTPVSGAMATNASSSSAASSQHMYGNGYQQQVQYQQTVPISEPHSPEDHDSFHMSGSQSVQSQQQQQQPKGLGGHRPAVLDIAALQPRLSQLSLGQMSAATAAMMTPMGGAPYSASAVSTPGGMMLPMANTRSVNSNDQNPPCNTIYVGNLPFGAKEDELFMIFRNSLGYKRMSYRAKPNSGPMCFVEFENIDFATLAMNEHDGRMLTNSVNGGIRLSYSKNPLGVRAQGNPTTPTSAGGFQHMVSAAPSPYGYSSAIAQPLMQNTRLHGVSPVHQGMSGFHHKDTSPSPPAQAQHYQQPMAYNGHYHQLSISSSSATSPMPSPNTAVHNGNTNDDLAVPKDALSFLHQPIHQLHKQATSGDPTNISTGPSTPPLTSTANIALD
ncbi:hypothetical protein LPJ71_005732 [Coemansia sp. S17]|nr:hypothetical protein LPJ71_005732 [Coemansia sp. S17]